MRSGEIGCDGEVGLSLAGEGHGRDEIWGDWMRWGGWLELGSGVVRCVQLDWLDDMEEREELVEVILEGGCRRGGGGRSEKVAEGEGMARRSERYDRPARYGEMWRDCMYLERGAGE